MIRRRKRTEGTLLLKEGQAWSGKALQIRFVRPASGSQWLRAFWNANVFIHQVPLIKTEIGVFAAVEALRRFS